MILIWAKGSSIDETPRVEIDAMFGILNENKIKF
jgi:hypothetical protein